MYIVSVAPYRTPVFVNQKGNLKLTPGEYYELYFYNQHNLVVKKDKFMKVSFFITISNTFLIIELKLPRKLSLKKIHCY